MADVPKGRGPFMETHEAEGWRVHVRSIVGRVRTRLEDAWTVLPAATLGSRTGIAFGVFDGLGGLPKGQEAAWAAAEAAPDALSRASGPEEVLRLLNERVRPTGGCTTAVVGFFPTDETPADGVLLSIGDSSAHLGPPGPERLNPHDAVDATTLTDFLGRSDISGHRMDVHLESGQALLLCTDGVDGVVEADALAEVLAAPATETEARLKRLFDRIDDAGSPDNATVVLARRTA